MSSLAHAYREAKHKSKVTSQYKCIRCLDQYWWGDNGEYDDICGKCGDHGEKLNKSEMIGIGWFRCECGKIFAGFCKGCIASKCFKCDRDVLPAFVVEGDDAGQQTEKKHQCNACEGRGRCPVIEQAKAISNKRAR